MGIEMYFGSSDQQAQSVSSVLGKRMNAYQSLQASSNQFILNSSSLSGQTYASAKAYSQQSLLINPSMMRRRLLRGNETFF